MSGADQGEDRRLRTGSFLSEGSGAEHPPPHPPPQPPTTSTNAVTQLLPLVNPQPSVVDVPTVRAVARRAAAALPALGGTEPPGHVPASARAAADRRRRAAGRGLALESAAAPETGAPEPPESRPPTGTLYGAPVPTPPDSTAPDPTPPDGPAPDGPVLDGPVLDGPALDDPVLDDPALDDPALDGPSPDAPAAVAPPASADAPHEPVRPEPAERRPRHAHPAEVTVLPHDGAPARPRHEAAPPDPVETSELPLVPAAALMGPAAQTDAWAAVEPAAPTDPVRPGPAPLAADSWDSTLGGAELEAYQGRRRVRSSARLWLVILLVLTGLGAAIGVPFLLSSGTGSQRPDSAKEEPGEEYTELPTSVGPTGELISAASSLGPSASPKSSRVTATPRPTVTASAAPLPFVPLTLQAEAATLAGSVSVDTNPNCFPGGPSVVSRVGNWGTGTPGVVTFTATVTTAGQYSLTIYYVITSDASRQAQVTVNSTSQTVTFLNTERAESPPTCVDPQPVIMVNLVQGANTIRISNGTARAPTLDRIVLAKP